MPVLVRPSSRWMFGAAIETIVWSMNIIATAKIIAASTRFLGPLRPVALFVDIAPVLLSVEPRESCPILRTGAGLPPPARPVDELAYTGGGEHEGERLDDKPEAVVLADLGEIADDREIQERERRERDEHGGRIRAR